MALQEPFTMGDLTLKNRVCLAPLTRARAGQSRMPNDIMGDYYVQRSSGGLVITEATAISEQGYGWHEAPGCYTQEQAAGWKKIVDRVHKANGVIFLQLWHMGRQGHSSYGACVGPSEVAVGSGQTTTADGTKADYEVPRALETKEVGNVVKDFVNCAKLAKWAGFDGVEIHSANGYLVDEFLQSCSNKRTDKYGGSKENRVRFLVEIVEALMKVYPANRIGYRISPNGAFGGMGSADNYEMFPFVAKTLNQYGLAYVHVMDGLSFGFHKLCKPVTCADIRKVWDGPIMANVELTQGVAEGMLRSGTMDLACFGRLYMSNPDLPERFKNGWPLADPAPYECWWPKGGGAKGYTDWPVYDAKTGPVKVEGGDKVELAKRQTQIDDLKKEIALLKAKDEKVALPIRYHRIASITHGDQTYRFKLYSSTSAAAVQTAVRSRFGIPSDQPLVLVDDEGCDVVIDGSLETANYKLETQ